MEGGDDRIMERERLQIEQIRQLDSEELQVEEVDVLRDSSGDEQDILMASHEVGSSNEFSFNTGIASLHTYLGDVEDTHHRTAFLDGGAILKLPLFYLEGVVLFPGATLPLRVIQSNFVAAVERALSHVDVPYTIGVIRVHRDTDSHRIKLATVGTTAEIRQYRRLEDGSLNVVTRGQQRFRLRSCWIDVEGVPCREIQIIEEDLPLATPRDAFGELENFSYGHTISHTSSPKLQNCKVPRSRNGHIDSENSEESFEAGLSPRERSIHESMLASDNDHTRMEESVSNDDDKFTHESGQEARSSLEEVDFVGTNPSNDRKQADDLAIGRGSTPRKACKAEGIDRGGKTRLAYLLCGTSRSFWPLWVYSMFDSYCLAQRVAEMWKHIVGVPSMDDLGKKPDLLSFQIASKMPVSESTRQELLEIDGISYRLRREIELLESINVVRCKNCLSVIARRSDMLVMSSEGPLGAYVNPSGYVHEIMTLYKANGLALYGPAVTEYSWFPGYAWTITNCATCETQMGWLFTATSRKLRPQSFWGIRSCQVAEETCRSL